MKREIEVKGIKPKKKNTAKILNEIPVGATIDGVTKTKPLTEYDYLEPDENVSKILITENDILTEEQEKELNEKITQENIVDLIKAVNEIGNEYLPKENIDLTQKVDVEHMCDVARKLFGIEKRPLKFEKFNDTCRDVADKQDKKKPYVAPECKVVDGDIKFGVNTPETEQPSTPKTFETIALELIDLQKRKNNDYGNAADKSFREFGLISYIIRLSDKLNRLKSLTTQGTKQMVTDETIIDTLKDLAAYSIMAIESLLSEEK